MSLPPAVQRTFAYYETGEILLTGVHPWPPPWLGPELCPVCGEGIREGDDNTTCLWCDSVSPHKQAILTARRIFGERRERFVEAHATLATQLRSGTSRRRRGRKAKALPTLTERQRRHYWFGGGKAMLRKNPDLCSTVEACRAWLKEIGQLPDWTLTHDRHGPLPCRRSQPGELPPCPNQAPAAA